jgi:PAS domain S-box-containing protein
MKNAANFFNSFVRDTELCIMGMLDIQGIFVRCNRGLENLLGLEEEELSGKPLSDFFLLDAEASIPAPGLEAWLRREERHTLECPGTGAAGEAFRVRLFLSALRDTEGIQRGYGIVIENLTPGLRLESAVRQSEDRFRKAFIAAPDGIVIASVKDSTVLEVNESWQAIFGYSREETVGKSSLLLKLVDPEVRESILERLLREGRIRDMEIRVRNKSGEYRDVTFSTETMVLEGIDCMMTTLRDVTAKKDAEKEARDKQKLYRTLAANFPNAIILLYDPDYKILVAEGSRLALFGLTSESTEGRNVRDISPPGYFAGVEKYYRSALDGFPAYHDAEFLDRHWAVDHVPVAGENGKVWAGLMVCRDVTELKNTILKLESSEQANRSLLEAIPDSILRLDREGKCTAFKPGESTLLTRWPKETVRGMPLEGFFPAEIASLLQSNRTKALAAGKSQICEFSLTSPTETREWEARTVPFNGLDTMLLLRDISGSRNLERLAANITAYEQRRLGGELHDGICQELTGISFLCKSLETKAAAQAPGLGVPISEISSLLADAIRHARALITGLYPSGLEHGLADALRELVNKLGKVYPSAFAFLGEDQEMGQDVAAHLFLIAQEAASNSARHAQAGSIRIHLGRQGGNLILKVSDDGLGLPEDTHASEGRGMHIMRYRARLIGAQFEAGSNTPTGASITCMLPEKLAYGFNPTESIGCRPE